QDAGRTDHRRSTPSRPPSPRRVHRRLSGSRPTEAKTIGDGSQGSPPWQPRGGDLAQGRLAPPKSRHRQADRHSSACRAAICIAPDLLKIARRSGVTRLHLYFESLAQSILDELPTPCLPYES